MKNIIALMLFAVAAALSVPAVADPRVPFDQWLAGLRTEALAEGISPPLVEKALAGLAPLPKVVSLDKAQPEFTQSFADYKSKRVTAERIAAGRRMMADHYQAVKGAADKYGVQPQYIVALWGMETNYGGYTGGYNIIEALATLAWNGRGGTRPDRATYFRKELITALRIIDQGHISLEKMKGSWAGAMGQVQFMPTSFMRLAQDGDGDGHKNIWESYPDAFASAANYLAQNGWNGNERWGRRVKLPAGFSASLAGAKIKKPVLEWRALGVTLPDGAALPGDAAMKASIIAPDGLSGQTFIAYENFHVIKRWNNSDKFALSVGHLADTIATAVPAGGARTQ